MMSQPATRTPQQSGVAICRRCQRRPAHFTGASGALGSHEPVVMTVDFGEARPLQRVEILWEFPAKSFSISLSSDGLSWAEVYSTDANGLKESFVNLGHQSARKLRLTMREVSARRACCLCLCVLARGLCRHIRRAAFTLGMPLLE